jgi:hypothetical protein
LQIRHQIYLTAALFPHQEAVFMHSSLRRAVFLFLFVCSLSFFLSPVVAQTNSGSVAGTVTDPTGAIIPGATVTIQNPVSGYTRTAQSNSQGKFQFTNLPFNPYHLTVAASGFGSVAQDANVESAVPVNVQIALNVAGSSTTVTVDAGDLLENDTTMHTDLDRKSFSHLPIESQSSSVSSLVTLTTPGVAADSNGLFHGLGDHAENSFSVDGQPITDQQSKVFSNQIPANSIQSIQVIDGAPPAEYGDKTSLVIVVTTRSGLGVTKPTGSVTSSYGSFGSSTGGVDLSYGGKNWGNFIESDLLNTGRFLDGPEFSVFHDKGNEENFFDRADYQWTPADSGHLNLNYTRSWFQTPNTFDNLNIGKADPLTGNPLAPTDQRSTIETFNIAPTYTHVIGSSAVFNFGTYTRKDAYYYYPSANPFSDLGPPSLQRETVAQERTLLNAGVHSDLSYVKGSQNLKAGGDYEQTILRESFGIGIVDPILNAPCINVGGQAVAGFTNPSQCAAAGYQPNVSSNPNAPNSVLYPYFNPVLLPYDVTRGGGDYHFLGRTDVKELALYVEDQITKGPWLFNLGIRGDLYNGLTVARAAEPRVGISYSIKPTSTVLRISYGRELETPFNENLVLSSLGPENRVIDALIPSAPARLNPGLRNEFHAGLEQAFGRYLVVDGDYLWKYTHNGFDFSVLGNTPITFPIEWHNSKISGFALDAKVPTAHGFSAFVVMSSVAARFFTPQVGGLGVVPAGSGSVTPTPFRIDHDEKFNQTTHLQYQIGKRGPWFGFNWRYDSGLVAGSTPCYANTATCAPSSTLLNGQPAVKMVSNNVFGVPLTADQEFEAGFYCGSQHATIAQALPFVCPASQFGSTLIKVPAPGTENDDHNPQRIRPRSLFDASFGDDNLFRGKNKQWSAKVTAVNITNNFVLYNWLSTFSGTHYVTPRAVTAQLGFHF